MQIIQCEQGSPEWYAARLGIPTASEFGTILTKGKGDKESLTRRTYLNKLAGEILTGDLTENYSGGHVERGKLMEHEARTEYAFAAGIEPELIGFIRNGNKGCSPDSLVGSNGLLEIKTALPHLLIDQLRRDEFPPDHKAQCQGQLWIAEREWIDIAVYWPKLPLYTKRAVRDEEFIKNLAVAVKTFNEELNSVVEFIRNYGRDKVAA